MGRTNPTYRDTLSAIEERWSPYRRTLRRCDRERFDTLFEYAREHADAAGTRNHRNPLVAALVGIALEQERRHDDAANDREGLADELAALADSIERLDGRLDRVETRLDDLEAVVDAAALDHQLAAADQPPAVTALANQLGDADIPEEAFDDVSDPEPPDVDVATTEGE
jgi:predicted RNase H-like nuclease (RuvC/YqgF family)